MASVIGGLVGGLIGAGVMSAGHALIITITGDGSAQRTNEEQDEDRREITGKMKPVGKKKRQQP